MSERELKLLEVATEFFSATVIRLGKIFLIPHLPIVKPDGFFCSDEHIRLPSKPKTIPFWFYIAVINVLPIIIIILLEIFLMPARQPFKFHRFTIPYKVMRSYNEFIAYSFGMNALVFMCDIAKVVVNNLRPNFIEVCKPYIDCNLRENSMKYITAEVCSAKKGELNRASGSFPSGHSSMTSYTMLYLAMYLHLLVRKRPSLRYLVYFLQFFCVSMVVLVGLTRVMDNHNHPGDVVAGLCLGIFMALVTTTHISKMFYANIYTT